MLALIFSLVVAHASEAPEFIDSKVDSKITWLLIGEDCAVRLEKAKLKDHTYVMNEIGKVCPEYVK